MRMYLEIINPIISILVLGICIWAAISESGNVDVMKPIDGGIPAYFLAKGLFCSSALFILGKILQRLTN